MSSAAELIQIRETRGKREGKGQSQDLVANRIKGDEEGLMLDPKQ